MSLDDAIADMKNKILAISPGAEIKVVKMSDEEARTLGARAGRSPGGYQGRDFTAGDGLSQQGRIRHSGLCLRQGCTAVERLKPAHPFGHPPQIQNADLGRKVNNVGL